MTDDAIQRYLANVPIEFQGVVTKLHALARKQMAGAHAMVYHGALGYAISEFPFDRIVYIAPQRNWVNLGFFFGSDLLDPQKLLEGEGARMRHVKIRTEAEARNPAIAKLLKAAWKKAPEDMKKLHARRQKK
jgi:uncharacterized protein DUF1801